MRSNQFLACWLVSCGVLAGCDSTTLRNDVDASRTDPSSATDGGSLDAGPRASAKLKGRIFDAESGRAIEAAELKSGDGTGTRSDKTGNFELEAKGEPETLEISRPSYAPSFKRAPKQAAYLELFLKGVDKKVTFDTADGVTLELPSGASVHVPPKAVRDDQNKRVEGKVTLELAEVDGHKRMQASALPGDMRARDDKGQEGRAGVHTALEIRIRDKEGAELTVGDKDKVTADLPIREKEAPSEREIFSYEKKSGAWVEEGKAKRVTKGDKEVYRAEIKHLSWWSYADFFAELTCVRACVETGSGKAVSGAQIWVVGASYPGATSLFTGDDGCAAEDVIAGERVVLVAQDEDDVSGPTAHDMTSSIHLVEDGAAACDDAGVLVLGPAPDSACAHGFVECDEQCTELATDVMHCGQCARACDADEPCLAGRCGTSTVNMDGSVGVLPDASMGVDAGADAGVVSAPDASAGDAAIARDAAIAIDAGSDAGSSALPDAASSPDAGTCGVLEGNRVLLSFDAVNPEHVTSVQWIDSASNTTPNLVAQGGPTSAACPDPTEFFGQAFGAPEGTTPSVVTSGYVGTLEACGMDVTIRGASKAECTSNAPPISAETTYHFYAGSQASQVRITRTIAFDANTPDTTDTGLRPYVPRVPYGLFATVIYPNEVGDAVTTTSVTSCPGDCLIATGKTWNGKWLAMLDPESGRALILLRDPAMTAPVNLTINYDGYSSSNLSSFVLLKPQGGWKAPITEVEYLCFADLTSWPKSMRDSATLPSGCGP